MATLNYKQYSYTDIATLVHTETDSEVIRVEPIEINFHDLLGNVYNYTTVYSINITCPLKGKVS